MSGAADITVLLRREIAARTGRDPDEIDVDAHFLADLGLSSLDLLGMLAFAEKSFALRFADDTLGELTTIRRVVAAIRDRKDPSREDAV